MITRENYSVEHIMDLYKSSKRDPNLIERVLFAFGLLEALRKVELPFIFKGASCIIKNVDVENTSEYNKTTDWQVSKNLIEQRGIYNEV